MSASVEDTVVPPVAAGRYRPARSAAAGWLPPGGPDAVRVCPGAGSVGPGGGGMRSPGLSDALAAVISAGAAWGSTIARAGKPSERSAASGASVVGAVFVGGAAAPTTGAAGSLPPTKGRSTAPGSGRSTGGRSGGSSGGSGAAASVTASTTAGTTTAGVASTVSTTSAACTGTGTSGTVSAGGAGKSSAALAASAATAGIAPTAGIAGSAGSSATRDEPSASPSAALADAESTARLRQHKPTPAEAARRTARHTGILGIRTDWSTPPPPCARPVCQTTTF